jgi:hypothetical protein
MYSFNEARVPEKVKAEGTLELTHSLEEEPREVEWKTAIKKRMPAADQSRRVTRLGLLNKELFMANDDDDDAVKANQVK